MIIKRVKSWKDSRLELREREREHQVTRESFQFKDKYLKVSGRETIKVCAIKQPYVLVCVFSGRRALKFNAARIRE